MINHACERCSEPAAVYDTYRGEALCGRCCCEPCAVTFGRECNYCFQFVSSSVPRDYLAPVEVER